MILLTDLEPIAIRLGINPKQHTHSRLLKHVLIELENQRLHWINNYNSGEMYHAMDLDFQSYFTMKFSITDEQFDLINDESNAKRKTRVHR